MEEIMRALGEHLRELGFTVEAHGDDLFPFRLPFVLEIGRDGSSSRFTTDNLSSHNSPTSDALQAKKLVLAEIEDTPGFLQVHTEYQDHNDCREIELANPGSIDEILRILNDYLVDNVPRDASDHHGWSSQV